MSRLVSEMRQSSTGRFIMTMAVFLVVAAICYSFAAWVAPTLSQDEAEAFVAVVLILMVTISAVSLIRVNRRARA